MKRKHMVWKLFLSALAILCLTATQVFAGPMVMPVPWPETTSVCMGGCDAVTAGLLAFLVGIPLFVKKRK